MIKYLVMDVDGTLTDGKIYMGNNGELMKAFSVKDGFAINYILRSVGIEPIIITGRTSKIVEERCKELGVVKVYQGAVDKLSALVSLAGDVKLSECAYFGDDIPDLDCMLSISEAGGLVGCPIDAVKEVKAKADYICINKAGEGALREFAEWLVNSRIDEKNISIRINDAVRYISTLDFNCLTSGINQVDENFYYFVREYDTKPIADCKLESHRKYVEIQWIVEGEEAIDIADVSTLVMKQEYDDEKDILFWNPASNMMRVVLQKGYIVLYPENAHRGCIANGNVTRVKKIVGKVRLF